MLIIAGMNLGMLGAQATNGPFWALATSRLSGRAAAASIALINSIGNLGGYFGPYIIGIGLARSGNGDLRGGLLAVGATLGACGGMALLLGAKRVGGEVNQVSGQ